MLTNIHGETLCSICELQEDQDQLARCKATTMLGEYDLWACDDCLQENSDDLQVIES